MSVPKISNQSVSLDSPRVIIVTRLEPLRTGTSKQGKPWVLYTVMATYMDGTPITETLRTFDTLVGTETVTCEAYVKNGSIEHYTLKRYDPSKPVKKAPTNANAPASGDVEARVAKLEQQVARLNRLVESLVELES